MSADDHTARHNDALQQGIMMPCCMIIIRSPMHYQPGEDFLLLSKLDGSIPFLSEHVNMVCSPSCSHFWIWLMMLTKHCLTVCLKNNIVSK